MKPAPFEYFAPATLAEAVALYDEHAAVGRLLAGGQSLVPLMNLRLADPQVLIDLNGVPELGSIASDAEELSIGSMTRHLELETSATIKRHVPMLAVAAGHIGYPAIRRRGTLGGSLAHADPAAELPLVALALKAEIDVVGPQGRRSIGASDFFRTYFSTSLAPGEVIEKVRFPVTGPGRRWSFKEMALHRGDFAILAVAVSAEMHEGAVAQVDIGLGGVGDRPVTIPSVSEALVGKAPTDGSLVRAGKLASTAVDPAADLHGGVRFRRNLIEVLTRDALREAFARDATVGGSA